MKFLFKMVSISYGVYYMGKIITLLVKPLNCPPEVFLGKSFLNICSKFTRDWPCRSGISIKLLYWNRTSGWVFFCKFTAFFRNTNTAKHLWRAAFVLSQSKSFTWGWIHLTNMRSQLNVGIISHIRLGGSLLTTRVYVLGSFLSK